MIEYVSLLMVSPDYEHVVVLEKNRPSFLAGRICPVGGHIEPGEHIQEAAQREFMEETGVETFAEDWNFFALCKGDGFVMHCLFCVSPNYAGAVTMTDEPVDIVTVSELVNTCIDSPSMVAPDMLALIGLVMQSKVRPSMVTINYDVMPEKAI